MPVGVRLFGSPAVADGARQHELGHTLDDALLCYLALDGRWLPRSVLAGRFWPDSDERSARANLRWRLHRVRNRPYARDLETTRDHVRWPVETDVARFWQAHAAGERARALELVSAPLLGDARFECSPHVEAAFQRERDEVHRAWRELALAHAEDEQAQRRYGVATTLLLRVLDYDLLDEDVLQAYLHAAYLDGQREQALRVFAAFERQLRDEFDIAPLAQTRALVATIKEADTLLGRAVAAGARPPERTSRAAANDGVHHGEHDSDHGADRDAGADALPRFLTPFLGRSDERERLTRLLSDHDERLVTVLGPGGVGKTRLAVEVARDLAPRFRDGVTFVDAAALEDPARLAPAIVERVAPQERVAHDPEAQLLDLVREREQLIVLDTFEHVFDAAALVRRLVTEAPGVRFLITSRLRLGVQGERTFEVVGLACPDDDATNAEMGQLPSVALFESVAARSLDGFRATERDRKAIARVCRLVGGLPLAVELAATWVRVLSCEAIAEELAADATLLTSATNGVHEHRHASFEQVFDTSWSLLRPADREVFAALSVFRGGFTRETARAVAGAELRHLRALIDASLVQRFDARYVLLDVLQRLAEERLEANGQAAAVRTRHAEHFAGLLHDHDPAFDGPDQGDVSMRLNPESDNFRAAWSYAVRASNVSILTRMSRGMSSLWDLRGRFAEAAELFATAAAALERVERSTEQSDEAALGWAWMRMREGWFRFYLGEYDAIQGVLAEASERFERFGETAAAGTTAYVLANAATARGDLAAGREHLTRAIDAYQRAGDSLGLAKCESALGMAEEALGNVVAAHAHYRRSLIERERSGDARGLIVVRNNLAGAALAMGALDEADRHLQHALRLCGTSADTWGTAWTAHTRGDLALARGLRDTARAHYEQALKGLERLGHHYAATLPRERLGELLLATAPDEAAEHLRGGLRAALSIGARPRIIQLAAWLAWIRAHDDAEGAVTALACARAAAGQLDRPRALTQRLLDGLRDRLTPDAFARAERRGAELDLRAEAEALLRWSEVAAWPPGLQRVPDAQV